MYVILKESFLDSNHESGLQSQTPLTCDLYNCTTNQNNRGTIYYLSS